MRTIGVVTTSRADFGIYRPVLRAIEADSGLDLQLFVTGMHLSPEFGMTVHGIEAEGFRIQERVEMLLSSDSPEGLAKSMGLGLIGFGTVYSRTRPDLLLVLGDRFEMFAAAAASMPFNIPIAHIHGGESTEGLIDEPIRHSITKMSHLHFASNETYARRIVQMGEEPWRVTVSGAPSLDNLNAFKPASREDLAKRVGIELHEDPVLVTFHPVTLDHKNTSEHIEALLASLGNVERPIIITYPNADTEGRLIIQRLKAFAQTRNNVRLVKDLGSQAYYSLMNIAVAMVGNSSSGIIEAGSFELPVVNVGDRQRGRVRGENVIDVECTAEAISEGLRRACMPAFRAGLRNMGNPYGDGSAAQRIVQRLAEAPLGERLLKKRFHDVPGAP